MEHDPNPGWVALDAECTHCMHRWAAVAPVEAGIGSLECPECGAHRSQAYTPRNNTAWEHLMYASRIVARIYADLPTDHPAEAPLAGAINHLAAVAGREVDGPFGPYFADGHLGLPREKK